MTSYREKHMPIDEYKKLRSEESFEKGLKLYQKFKKIFVNKNVPCHKRVEQFICENDQILRSNAFEIEELKYLSHWTESRKFAIQNEKKRKQKLRPLTHHRISKKQTDRLEEIKFQKTMSHDERWNSNYEKLVRYKESYYSVDVKKANDKSLYMWLYHQKRAYKNKCRMDNGLKPLSKSRINSEQIEKLEVLGVKFFRSRIC